MKARWGEQGEFEITRRYQQPEHIRWDQDRFRGDAYPTYSWGANAVAVEIDPVTCEVSVTGVWGVYDIGTPIDEKIVQGQMMAASAQAGPPSSRRTGALGTTAGIAPCVFWASATSCAHLVMNPATFILKAAVREKT